LVDWVVRNAEGAFEVFTNSKEDMRVAACNTSADEIDVDIAGTVRCETSLLAARLEEEVYTLLERKRVSVIKWPPPSAKLSVGFHEVPHCTIKPGDMHHWRRLRCPV